MRLAAALLALSLVGVAPALPDVAQADDRCVLRLDRGDVDIDRGELRIDLGRAVRRQCGGVDGSRLRLDTVTVVLEEQSFRDRPRDGRYRRGDTVDIFRFVDGLHHFVSDDPTEGRRRGYGRNEGVLFQLFADGGRGRRAVYACSVPSRRDHFLSAKPDCEGQRVERLLGFVAESPTRQAPRALYRCFHGRVGDHLTTTKPDECRANGYAVEPILGYVP